MKKRMIALLGACVMLLSACATGSTINDAKKVYEGKEYSLLLVSKTFEANPEAELIKEKADDISNYVTKYVTNLLDEDNVKRHTVNAYDILPELPAANANFNARVDAEEEWAKSYGEEFTYEISDGMVSATLSASKTVTADEDKNAGFSVGYAFSYAANYDKEGLLSSSKLTICIVKTNDKDKSDVAKYQVTSTMSATW